VKRIVVAGILVAILALFAVPAYAQSEGSVLPTPSEDEGVLPDSPSEDEGVLPDSPDEDEAAAAADEAALADTGIDTTTALLVGAGLLAVGGVSLVVARRRGSSA
jgi:LPXTG-motif cell wall-anchored protein